MTTACREHRWTLNLQHVRLESSSDPHKCTKKINASIGFPSTSSPVFPSAVMHRSCKLCDLFMYYTTYLYFFLWNISCLNSIYFAAYRNIGTHFSSLLARGTCLLCLTAACRSLAKSGNLPFSNSGAINTRSRKNSTPRENKLHVVYDFLFRHIYLRVSALKSWTTAQQHVLYPVSVSWLCLPTSCLNRFPG